jgi:hypothetical protein
MKLCEQKSIWNANKTFQDAHENLKKCSFMIEIKQTSD